MMNFTETREMTSTKIKAEVKTAILEDIATFLAEKYGADNIGMVRIGSSLSKKNTLAARVGTVEANGDILDTCVTIDISAKDYADRVTTSKVFNAFDFDAARADYDSYVEEKAIASASKAAKKAEKIAKDSAARKS